MNGFIEIPVLPVSFPEHPGYEALKRAFSEFPVLAFQQAWLEVPEAGFEGGTVQLAWESSTCRLHVFAQMNDRDIYSPDAELNTPFFLQGDTFELFLKPAESEAYVELHVGAQGQCLQLRFPSVEEMKNRRTKGSGFPHDLLLAEPCFSYELWRKPDEAMWSVYAVIPLDTFSDQRALSAGDRWDLSFCRYNYSQGEEKPVISSTSPFTRADFHRTQEWLSFTLGGIAHQPCERCGDVEGVLMGERCLCQRCYYECNSCCGEFGGDDQSVIA
ncbi:hypothetical protein P3T73_00605 [Kiritimatiellota bacterium B12222]|nr:hypothetical protein P3T73_00605 [Kiritimatiellota bacterium B12222]